MLLFCSLVSFLQSFMTVPYRIKDWMGNTKPMTGLKARMTARAACGFVVSIEQVHSLLLLVRASSLIYTAALTRWDLMDRRGGGSMSLVLVVSKSWD